MEYFTTQYLVWALALGAITAFSLPFGASYLESGLGDAGGQAT